jgi:hypothetical protein
MEDFTGDNGQGTVESTGTEVSQSTESTQVQDTSAGQVDHGGSTGQEIPQDVGGLLKTVESLRAEIERKEQYSQFLKEYIDNGAITPQQGQQAVDNFDLDDDVIPYAGDVKKMIEAKVNAIVEQRISKMEEQNVLSQMKAIGDQKRASDAGFDSRMDQAIELLRDPAYAAAYNRVPNDASLKVAFLEKIAPFHPNYSGSSVQKNNLSQDVINRIQANAAIPATLSSMGSVGNTQRSVTDMTDAEFAAFREKQRRDM